MSKQIYFILIAGLLSISVSAVAQKPAKPDNSEQVRKERVEKSKERVQASKERVEARAKTNKERFEKFKASREEFLVKKLQLTDSEKASFLALDTELQTKRFELHKELREATQKLRNARQEKQAVAEADYKKLLDLIAQTKLKEAQLEQEYIAKFLKVVTAEKVYLYQRADKEFAEKLVHDRRAQAGGPAPGQRPNHKQNTKK
jgi:hypothetical protein